MVQQKFNFSLSFSFPIVWSLIVPGSMMKAVLRMESAQQFLWAHHHLQIMEIRLSPRHVPFVCLTFLVSVLFGSEAMCTTII